MLRLPRGLWGRRERKLLGRRLRHLLALLWVTCWALFRRGKREEEEEEAGPSACVVGVMSRRRTFVDDERSGGRAGEYRAAGAVGVGGKERDGARRLARAALLLMAAMSHATSSLLTPIATFQSQTGQATRAHVQRAPCGCPPHHLPTPRVRRARSELACAYLESKSKEQQRQRDVMRVSLWTVERGWFRVCVCACCFAREPRHLFRARARRRLSLAPSPPPRASLSLAPTSTCLDTHKQTKTQKKNLSLSLSLPPLSYFFANIRRISSTCAAPTPTVAPSRSAAYAAVRASVDSTVCRCRRSRQYR